MAVRGDAGRERHLAMVCHQRPYGSPHDFFGRVVITRCNKLLNKGNWLVAEDHLSRSCCWRRSISMDTSDNLCIGVGLELTIDLIGRHIEPGAGRLEEPPDGQ